MILSVPWDRGINLTYIIAHNKMSAADDTPTRIYQLLSFTNFEIIINIHFLKWKISVFDYEYWHE